MMLPIVILIRDNDDKYYGTQQGLKEDFDPHVDVSATYLWFHDDAESQSTKTWFSMGILRCMFLILFIPI